MLHAYTVEQIRAAEKPLLEAQTAPDDLMKSAAHAVFEAAGAMLRWPDTVGDFRESPKCLLLVGKGGNGGDALYAGAELALAGHAVDAWLAWGSAHEPALEAFTNAGGTVLKDAPEDCRDYRLAIDGLTGIGGAGGLDEQVGQVLDGLADWYVHVLAVDVPSGVNADTGECGDIHVTADATVTFGGWRRAHGLAPECGIQLLAQPSIADGRSIADELDVGASDTVLFRAVPGETPQPWPDSLDTLPADNEPLMEPGFYDDKYTGGVVGIRAGSATYPGAALLATTGAVRATPAMVRYAGSQAGEVVRGLPEVVVKQRLEDAGRVQAWVFGPGVGTDSQARGELALLLGREEPLLIDADGLTLLSTDPELRELLRGRPGETVLTPHDGECERLRDALGIDPASRWEEAQALSQALNCTVVRKGRATIVADPARDYTLVVDTGTSWAATPGSGDVLAGIMGARMAREQARWGGATLGVAQSVIIHATAAWLSAQTEFGPGPTSASKIAESIPAATAKLRVLPAEPAANRAKKFRGF